MIQELNLKQLILILESIKVDEKGLKLEAYIQDIVKRLENKEHIEAELQKKSEETEALELNKMLWENRIKAIPSIAERNIVLLLNMFPAGLTEYELR